MVNIIKEEIDIEEALRKKLEFVCSFCNTNCEIKKCSIMTIERTNLSYVVWYDKDDKYIDVVNDMYEDNILDNDDIEELDLNKEKDDYKCNCLNFNLFYYSLKQNLEQFFYIYRMTL